VIPINLPLPDEKKLTVEFRLEPSCLGPDGETHIVDFCTLAQKHFSTVDTDFIHWKIIPRHDKSLPERQYLINNKKLTIDQARKYLHMFNRNIEKFEQDFDEELGKLINQFLGY
jgi:hypothetical protein